MSIFLSKFNHDLETICGFRGFEETEPGPLFTKANSRAGQLLVPQQNGPMGRQISRNSETPQLKVNKSRILEDNFKTQLEMLSQAKGFEATNEQAYVCILFDMMLYKHQGLV